MKLNGYVQIYYDVMVTMVMEEFDDITSFHVQES